MSSRLIAHTILAVGSTVVASAYVGAGPAGPCDVTCPPDAIAEDEPCLFGVPDPVDSVNGGCLSDPPVFHEIGCGDTICGQFWFDGTSRDTDWFRYDNCAQTGAYSFSMHVMAEAPAVFGRVENEAGALDCSEVTSFAEVAIARPCELVVLNTTTNVDGTEFWFMVAPDWTQIVDRTGDAVFTLACDVVDPCWYLSCDWTCDDAWGFDDLLAVLAKWGPCCAPSCPDFDGDEEVGFADLLVVLAKWGPCV